MGASLFLIINAFIVFFLVIRIVFMGLSRSRPTLHQPEDEKPAPNQGARMEFFDIFTGATRPKEKSLNCPFTFQGVSYDAYEVFGVPAGAPKALWAAAFKDMVRGANGDRKQLLEAALKALETHRFS